MPCEVFISYSSKDKSVADALLDILERRGIGCWIAPRNINPGMDWAKSIVEAIDDSKIMALVFSAHSDASPQVLREVNHAVNRGVIILPIRIENILPSGSMGYFINVCHWFDALTPPIAHELERAAEIIGQILTVPAAIQGVSDRLSNPKPPPTQLKHARFRQKWQRPGVFNPASRQPVGGAREIHRVGGQVVIYHETDAGSGALSVLSAETGDVEFVVSLVGSPFELEDFALIGSSLYLRGSVSTTPQDVRWVQQVDCMAPTTPRVPGAPMQCVQCVEGRRYSAPVAQFNPECFLDLTLKEYNDLPWRDLRADISRPPDQRCAVDSRQLHYSDSRYQAIWRSPTESIMSVSTMLHDELSVLIRDGRIYCLGLEPGEGYPPGSSDGHWYRTIMDSPGGDLHVECQNCGYTEWYDRRGGQHPASKCPCCFY